MMKTVNNGNHLDGLSECPDNRPFQLPAQTGINLPESADPRPHHAALTTHSRAAFTAAVEADDDAQCTS